RGAVYHKQKRYTAALADFNTLLARFPKSPLQHGAREELALLHEAVGDLGGALEQYFALGYQTDVAFLLDARMTRDEMRRYMRLHRDMPYRLQPHWGEETPPARSIRYTRNDVIAYSLGIRCLRDERWDEAE